MRSRPTQWGLGIALLVIGLVGLWLAWPRPEPRSVMAPESTRTGDRTVDRTEELAADPVGTSLRVTVADDQGGPLAGVRVELLDGARFAETGESGDVTFEQVPCAVGSLRCEHVAWGTLEAEFDLGAQDSIELRYTPSARLALLLIRPDGSGESSRVEIYAESEDRSKEARLVTERVFRSEFPEQVQRFEELPIGRMRVVVSDEYGPQGDVFVDIPVNSEEYEAEFRLLSKAELSRRTVVLVTLDGEPLPHEEVTITSRVSDAMLSPSTEKTDREGRFWTSWGRFRPDVRAVAHLSAWRRVDGIELPTWDEIADPDDVRLEFHRGTPDVYFRSESGRPLVGIVVSRTVQAPLERQQYSDDEGRVDSRDWSYGEPLKVQVASYRTESPPRDDDSGPEPRDEPRPPSRAQAAPVYSNTVAFDGSSEIRIPVEATLLTVPDDVSPGRHGRLVLTYRHEGEEVLTDHLHPKFPLSLAHRSSVGELDVELRLQDAALVWRERGSVGTRSAPIALGGVIGVSRPPMALELKGSTRAPLKLALVDRLGQPAHEVRLLFDLKRPEGDRRRENGVPWTKYGALRWVQDSENEYWLSEGRHPFPDRMWFYDPAFGLASVRVDELVDGTTIELGPDGCLVVSSREHQYCEFEVHYRDGHVASLSSDVPLLGPGRRLHLPLSPHSEATKLVLRGPRDASARPSGSVTRSVQRTYRDGTFDVYRILTNDHEVELAVTSGLRTIEAP